MSLNEFILTCFYWIDEMLPTVIKGQRLRERGPAPRLADSEVLTMEVVGTYLGQSQDSEVFRSFQRHYRHFFSWHRPRASEHVCPTSSQSVGHQRASVDGLA